MPHRALLVCLLTLSGLVAPPSAAQQAPPAVDRTLVDRFVAGSDAERDALISQHAEILTAPFRSALSNRGGELRRAGDPAAAESIYLALLHIGRHHVQPLAEVAALLGLGAVEYGRGEFPKSLTWIEQGLVLATATNNLPGRQQALSNRATVRRRLGDIDGSFDDANASIAMARQIGDPLALARVLNNTGISYQDIGLATRAMEYYTESLQLKEQNGAIASEQTTTLSNIGSIYAIQGDFTLAEDFYTRALAKTDPSEIDAISNIYNNLAQMYEVLDNSAKARQYLQRSIALAEKIEDPARLATSLYLLGSLDSAEGRLEAAEATQRRVLELREALSDRLALVESLTEMTSLLDRRGRAAEGLPYGERAVALATESHLRNQLWIAQLAVGRAHATLGHDAEARALYRAAIDTLETLRQFVAGGTRAQQNLMTTRVGPYYALAALDVRAGRAFDALAGVDRARARALTDILAMGRSTTDRLTAADRDDDTRLNRAVLAAADAMDNATKAGASPKDLADLDARLTAARNAREAFLVTLYARHPDLRFARGNTPELTPERLATVVEPGSALVTFVLDENAAWTYVVTRGATGPVVNARRLELPAAKLTAMAETFSRQIATRDLAFSTTARALYDALLGGSEAALAGATKIVIIPDGPLWRVPFQALRTPRNAFLVEEHAVSYTPSITALAALEERRRARVAPEPFLVALGDPAVAAAGAGAGNPQRGATTARLPEAAKEVRALGQLYGASKSAVLVDTDATESAMRGLVSRASVLHVATHGFLENGNPMYSHLLLADGPASPSRDHLSDGRLEAWEVLDMDIRANVAVLSACRTAGGTGFGEGVIGLSWSLFAAGASTAVVSHWEVDSASTTSLMIAFHQGLLKGARLSPPEALRQAQITMLKSSQFRHPFYWAGLVSIGAR